MPANLGEAKNNKFCLIIFHRDDAEVASFATTGGLSPQRSAACRPKGRISAAGEFRTNERKLVQMSE